MAPAFSLRAGTVFNRALQTAQGANDELLLAALSRYAGLPSTGAAKWSVAEAGQTECAVINHDPFLP
jgi:hypothetical protein